MSINTNLFFNCKKQTNMVGGKFLSVIVLFTVQLFEVEPLPCSQTNIADCEGRELPFNAVKEALLQARMSLIAYDPCSSVQNNLPDSYTLSYCMYDRETDTEGYIAEGADGSVIVAFRGSEINSFTGLSKDWVKTNIQGGLTPRIVTSGRVRNIWCSRSVIACIHGGYYKALNTVYVLILNKLEQYIRNGQKIYVTGHSLGGALATIFTYQLIKDYGVDKDQVQMFIYGTPPVGNQAFIREFNSLKIISYQMTIIGDIVSYRLCLVPQIMSLYYSKPTENVYYLPEVGGHFLSEYTSQLELIQDRQDYNEAYGIDL